MSSVKMVSHVRSVFLNWRRAGWTACFIVITAIVHPAQSQQTKLAEQSLASTLQHGALTSISDKTASNAVAMVTTTRPVFESVIVGQRTLADATQHREITTIGDAKAISDLFALVVDFEAGFPVVEPGR
jgi:alkyl sulfatase BDS1-like metallo-beta-lactamase superfamily hydrolase